MSAISNLSIELRIKLNAVESELGAISSRIAQGEPSAELFVQAYLRRLIHRLERKRATRMDAEAEVRQWQGELQNVSGAPPRGSPEELQQRLAVARRRSFATMEIATAAIDEATCAALQAWLVENEVGAGREMKPGDDGTET